MNAEIVRINHNELKERIIPLFKEFCADDIVEHEIKVVDEDEHFFEMIDLSDKSFINHLRISRIIMKNDHDASTEDTLFISLHWSDDCDTLTYTNDYFARIDNETVVKKVSFMMETALKMFNHDTFKEEEDYE